MGLYSNNCLTHKRKKWFTFPHTHTHKPKTKITIKNTKKNIEKTKRRGKITNRQKWK